MSDSFGEDVHWQFGFTFFKDFDRFSWVHNTGCHNGLSNGVDSEKKKELLICKIIVLKSFRYAFY